MNLTDWNNYTLLVSDQDFLVNESLKEIFCYLDVSNRLTGRKDKQCNATWDGLSCWPSTPIKSVAVISCFSEFNDIYYDITQNASRICKEDGTWAEKADYSRCRPLISDNEQFQVLWDIKEASTIYYIGYSLSLVALIVALTIFVHFKDLKCLRNTIHTNLIITYILNDLTWIVTATLQSSSSPNIAKAACPLVIILTYLMGTNFFWMFVEGLYLYILVVKTFSVDTVKFYLYIIIGWGLPAFVVALWATVKSFLATFDDGPLQVKDRCTWQSRDNYDYIFICPIILVLVINIYFLAEIMWVLITKLRAATSVESKQYRKASKALLVLIPLLGITYVVVLVTPAHGIARVIFTYLQATLLSTQGFTVAVLYCFLNGEVRNSVRHYIARRRIQRTIRSAPRPSLSSHETLRLYPSRAIRDQDSFATTDSWISSRREKSISEQRPSNGCYDVM